MGASATSKEMTERNDDRNTTRRPGDLFFFEFLDPEIAIPLANYIDGTGRFKVKPGEHMQTQSNTTARESQTR